MDVKSSDELFKENQGLVYDILHKRDLWSRSDRDDLVQEGMLALWRASRSYDPYRGVKFSTYAYSLINGYLLRYLRDNTYFSGMRVPRRTLDLITKIQRGLEETEDSIEIREVSLRLDPVEIDSDCIFKDSESGMSEILGKEDYLLLKVDEDDFLKDLMSRTEKRVGPVKMKIFRDYVTLKELGVKSPGVTAGKTNRVSQAAVSKIYAQVKKVAKEIKKQMEEE